MSWIKDIFHPQERSWEEFYRNRWQHDKRVRSTHGVNCTGGCSWEIFVKDGIVTWELQKTDYPKLKGDLPPYEPRGCQRGISFSWYLYSPIRVKYPYIRGVLIDLWQEAKKTHRNLMEAWASIVEDEKKRHSFHQARGKGGFRRTTWDEVLEIIAIAQLYTAKKYGPDRVYGFSPIPAMSMLSYASGSRMLQLFGGVGLSFYDWYSDLPNASPEIWGEQTDVAESADWYHSKFIVSVGSCLSMTRTPDVHFVAEARHNGSKFVVFSPDFSQVAKYADWWIPIHAGQDGAFWMAVTHVILKEFHAEKKTPYFINYLKKYTDTPFLVEIEKKEDGSYIPGRLLRANTLNKYKNIENGNWKFLIFDQSSREPRSPQGSIGHRWQKEKGRWNLEMKDEIDQSELNPLLSFLEDHDKLEKVSFTEFSSNSTFEREVPIKYIQTSTGKKVPVITIYDLLMAQYGVSRGLSGAYPKNYDDKESSYTPAWQEQFTGIHKDTVIQFAREWASTAEKTQGKCTIIIGAGVNHWYHNNLMYRACIAPLMLCGCIGKNGGGLNHYVGQEKLAPVASWGAIALAKDWVAPPKLQNTPSWHYAHTDQWRYEQSFTQYHTVPKGYPFSQGHTIDLQAKAVRMGWLPWTPQFNKNSIEIVKDAKKSGAKTNEEIIKWVVDQLKKEKLKFSIEDVDAPENWPRLWFIWRGNALMSSAKGHEYFLKHYLGTHTHTIADDQYAKDSVKEVKWHKNSPKGKMDLVVDINFRMDTSALYSDIVLPTATWYEKDDLNSTDMHSFIHPLSEAVPPCWESKSDWDIFKLLSKKVSELAATYFPEPFQEIVAVPLLHDTPAEIAQPEIKDWKTGACDLIPGKTMPKLVVVERNYVDLYHQFISLGPLAKEKGIGAHGVSWKIDDMYEDLVKSKPVEKWNGKTYPSLYHAKDAANVILYLAPETNGKACKRAWEAQEKQIGLPLMDLIEGDEGVENDFQKITHQPQRLLTSPCWSGITKNGRAYSGFCLNIDKLIPWRTLTGRQHFYLDHQGYIAFGENLPTYKPMPHASNYGDLVQTKIEGKSLQLNYLTPHGKWHIHSTYSENHRMLTLSRGGAPLWLNDHDANTIGVNDNDWVEVHNDHGVVVTRCIVSARIPKGICMLYHSPERTIAVPKSPLRKNRRAGGHNSLTRIRLKPTCMMGGYAQFTYHFNYWGPTGVNRDTYIIVRKLEGKPKW